MTPKLAILYDPNEIFSPSNRAAIDQFIKAAARYNIECQLITKDNFNDLEKFDALFIRETTSLNHHTYEFALKAQELGLIVIDDPVSIKKCTDKIFQINVLTEHNIKIPKTIICGPANLENLNKLIHYPIVLKLPDSSFSRGVFKANSKKELLSIGNELLTKSPFIVAQEFVYTNFDWRIGVLNDQPIFACQYFMSRRHWKVTKFSRTGKHIEGDSLTLALADVPTKVIETALQAAKLIGNGFYGVDLKEVNGNVYVIEINDNPSIDAGIEDAILHEKLYETVMQYFAAKIKLKNVNKFVALVETA